MNLIEKLNSYSLTDDKIKEAVIVLTHLRTDRHSFQLVSINYCLKSECVYFKGIFSDESEERFVISLSADALLSSKRLHCLFSSLTEQEGRDIHVLTLGLVGTDSSVVYYNLVLGLHPPND